MRTNFKALVLFTLNMLVIMIWGCSSNPQNSKNSRVLDMAWQADKYLWTIETGGVKRWDVQTKQAQLFSNIGTPVRELLVDSNNTVWVFGVNSFSRFDGQEWVQYTPDDKFVGRQLWTVVEGDEYIWVGTSGLSRVNKRTSTWETLLSKSPGPAPTAVPTDQGIVTLEGLTEGVHAIAPVSRDEVWFGTDRGLTRLKGQTQQTWGNQTLRTDGVRCILPNSDGTIWVCLNEKVGKWDWKNNSWASLSKDVYDPIALSSDRQGNVWILTWESGGVKWNGNSWEEFGHLGPGIRPRSIIASALNNDVWIGSTEGVIRWDGKEWRTYGVKDGLAAEQINALLEDPHGIIWVGTDEGINYYDPETDQWKPFP